MAVGRFTAVQKPPEKVTVLSVSSDGRTVTLASPLIQTHVSEVLKYNNAVSGNWEVDMRCEVALLSRNVIIQGGDKAVQ